MLCKRTVISCHTKNVNTQYDIYCRIINGGVARNSLGPPRRVHVRTRESRPRFHR